MRIDPSRQVSIEEPILSPYAVRYGTVRHGMVRYGTACTVCTDRKLCTVCAVCTDRTVEYVQIVRYLRR